jgi:hypothetical protein
MRQGGLQRSQRDDVCGFLKRRRTDSHGFSNVPRSKPSTETAPAYCRDDGTSPIVARRRTSCSSAAGE